MRFRRALEFVRLASADVFAAFAVATEASAASTRACASATAERAVPTVSSALRSAWRRVASATFCAFFCCASTSLVLVAAGFAARVACSTRRSVSVTWACARAICCAMSLPSMRAMSCPAFTVSPSLTRSSRRRPVMRGAMRCSETAEISPTTLMVVTMSRTSTGAVVTFGVRFVLPGPSAEAAAFSLLTTLRRHVMAPPTTMRGIRTAAVRCIRPADINEISRDCLYPGLTLHQMCDRIALCVKGFCFLYPAFRDILWLWDGD